MRHPHLKNVSPAGNRRYSLNIPRNLHMVKCKSHGARGHAGCFQYKLIRNTVHRTDMMKAIKSFFFSRSKHGRVFPYGEYAPGGLLCLKRRTIAYCFSAFRQTVLPYINGHSVIAAYLSRLILTSTIPW